LKITILTYPTLMEFRRHLWRQFILSPWAIVWRCLPSSYNTDL